MGITQQIGASSLIRPGVIDNAAARPASPFEGQCIFQKDTDQLLVWNGTAWVIPNAPAQNPMGLELISQGTNSGATSYNHDNVFTSTYLNYRVLLSHINVQNAGRAIRLKFRAGGATNANTNYDYGFNGYKANNTANNTAAAGATFTEIGVYLDAAGNEFGCSSLDIFRPVASERTMTTVVAQGLEGSFYWRSGGFVQTQETSFDGFMLELSGTGNFSYQYAIYGYRNS